MRKSDVDEIGFQLEAVRAEIKGLKSAELKLIESIKELGPASLVGDLMLITIDCLERSIVDQDKIKDLLGFEVFESCKKRSTYQVIKVHRK
jgi:hypothetical protein